jgi:hypothetical protein
LNFADFFLDWLFHAANFALVAAKKAQEKKRISITISGARFTTVQWLRERAVESDLPFSKYVSLWLDAIKSQGEEMQKGGGGNRTRPFLADWFPTAKDRRAA